jgi:hypothetical protein
MWKPSTVRLVQHRSPRVDAESKLCRGFELIDIFRNEELRLWSPFDVIAACGAVLDEVC